MLLKNLYDTLTQTGAAVGRRWMHTLLACTLLSVGFAAQANTEASQTGQPTSGSPAPVILVVGDSLSAEYGLERNTGWVSLLQERLKEQGFPHRIHNASISGDTTSGGAARLPTLLRNVEPEIVIIELGGNDALRGLPLHLSRDNLSRMVEASQEAGAKVIVAGMQIPPNYGGTYARQFQQLFVEVAENTNAALVPFLLEGLGLDDTYFQADRIHPTAAAQPIMLDNVWPVLVEVMGEAEGS